MPLIKPRANRVKKVRYVCRLEEPNRDALVAYGAFINEDPDYVLDRLISSKLTRDREFIAWRAEHAPTVISRARRRARVATPSDQTA